MAFTLFRRTSWLGCRRLLSIPNPTPQFAEFKAMPANPLCHYSSAKEIPHFHSIANRLFRKWVDKYRKEEKSYKTEEETLKRFGLFKQTLLKTPHMEDVLSNECADMTLEEEDFKLTQLFHRWVNKYGKGYTEEEEKLKEAVFKENLQRLLPKNWNSILQMESADLTLEELWAKAAFKEKKLFESWEAKFKKNYPSINEKLHRFSIFQQQRKQRTKEDVAVNIFLDLTEAEMKHYEGFKPDYTKEFPGEWDWRVGGHVAPVQNQGNSDNPDSCYIYSAISAIESKVSIDTGIKAKLADQEVVDNFPKRKVQDIGGSMHEVFKFAMTHGIHRLVDYGELPKSKSKFMKLRGKGLTTKIKGFKIMFRKVPKNMEQNHAEKEYLSTYVKQNMTEFTGDMALIQAAIVQPVCVNLCMSCKAVEEYLGKKEGDLFGHLRPTEENDKIYHAMVIEGFKKDCWIVRNSWGPRWGHNGYAYITRESFASMFMSAGIPEL